MATIGQVNVVVGDMAETVEFLRLLGVDVEDTLPDWMRQHRDVVGPGPSRVALDSTAFARMWADGLPDGWTGVVLSVNVDTRTGVDDTYARATAAGHRGVQEPVDAFWGSRFAAVEGPSGLVVGIRSDSDDDRRSRPPTPPTA